MIVLFLIWCVLGALAVSLGIVLASGFRIELASDAEDRGFQYFWIGLFGLGLVLLVASLAVPIGGWAGTVLVLAPVTAVTVPAIRAELASIVGSLGWRWLSAGAISALVAGLLASDLVLYFDTAFYHFQIARLLADFGSVPGLALIYENYGFASSWLALSAPLGNWIPVERSGGAINGLAALAALWQVLASGRRLAAGRGSRADWVVVCGLAAVLLLAVRWHMVASLSPDLPVLIAPVILAWMFCLDEGSAARNAPAGGYVLALLLIPIKLSALPLAAIAGLRYWSRENFRGLALARVAGLAVLFTAPLLAVYFVTTGCFVYPVAWTCTDVAWASPSRAVADLAAYITAGARFSGKAPADWFGHLFYWMSHDRSGAILYAVWLATGAAVLVLARRLDLKPFFWAIVLSLAGAIYAVFLAPTGRFAAGYLVILPAIIVAALAEYSDVRARLRDRPLLGHGLFVASIGVVVALAIALRTSAPSEIDRERAEAYIASHDVAGFETSRLLLPSPVLPFDLGRPGPAEPRRLTPRKLHDFAVTFPEGVGLCWAAEPICTKRQDPKVRLRDPAAGPAGGFVRADSSR